MNHIPNLNSSPFPNAKPDFSLSHSSSPSSSPSFRRDLIHQWIMDGWIGDFHLSRFSFSLSVFLLRDGCSANAGQHALEMSPGTSHSVCLSVCLSAAWRITLFLSVSESVFRLDIENLIQSVWYCFTACFLFYAFKINLKVRALAIFLILIFIQLPITFFIVHYLLFH